MCTKSTAYTQDSHLDAENQIIPHGFFADINSLKGESS